MFITYLIQIMFPIIITNTIMTKAIHISNYDSCIICNELMLHILMSIIHIQYMHLNRDDANFQTGLYHYNTGSVWKWTMVNIFWCLHFFAAKNTKLRKIWHIRHIGLLYQLQIAVPHTSCKLPMIQRVSSDLETENCRSLSLQSKDLKDTLTKLQSKLGSW